MAWAFSRAWQVLKRPLRDIQKQMQDIQNANCKLISEQLQIFRKIIHEMRNCDQLLFSRQQVNINFDTVASLLSLYYLNIKTYRAALFAYHINMFNSVPANLFDYVPMSLLNRESLRKVIKVIHYNQIYDTDHLILALFLKIFFLITKQNYCVTLLHSHMDCS